MSSDRALLHSLVDSLPEDEIATALSFLSELTEEEEIDSETAAKLDQAKHETGEDIPIDRLRSKLRH
jgi:cell division inhibitor SulA